MKGDSETRCTGFRGGSRYKANARVYTKNGGPIPGMGTNTSYSDRTPMMTNEDWDKFYTKREIIYNFIIKEMEKGLTKEEAITKLAKNPRIIDGLAKYRQVLKKTKLANTICSYEMVIEEICNQMDSKKQGKIEYLN